jgi:hypothetical protein
VSGGAFRDDAAALERIAVIEEENAALREELARADARDREARARGERREALRRENARLVAQQRSETAEAYRIALVDEHDALERQVKMREADLAEARAELGAIRKKAKVQAPATAPTPRDGEPTPAPEPPTARRVLAVAGASFAVGLGLGAAVGD